MFNISTIKISLECLWRNVPPRLVGVHPVYSYENGKKTEQLEGYSYDVVFPANGYQSLRVKVAETKPAIDQETLENLGEAPVISFDNFVGRIYIDRRDGKPQLSARADAVEVIR